MSGLDSLGADEIGFDYMSLIKGGAGMLSGAGGLMSGGGGGGGGDAAAAAEKRRLEDDKRRAEESVATMKTILIVIASLVGAGALFAVATGRKAVTP